MLLFFMLSRGQGMVSGSADRSPARVLKACGCVNQQWVVPTNKLDSVPKSNELVMTTKLFSQRRK